MRARSLTVTASAIVFSLLFSLLGSGPAGAIWHSLDPRVIQIQHVCRDGVVVDLASQFPTDGIPIIVADVTDDDPPPPPFFQGTVTDIPPVPDTDVPEMSNPLGYSVQFLGRNYELAWGTTRSPGDQVAVAFQPSAGRVVRTVEDCSINDRFDPFTVGYVWAHDPTAGSYTPGPYWSYNSRMLRNTVERKGVGRYVVTFPGLATTGGNAHVSAFGATAANCKIGPSRWRSHGGAMRLDVRCFTADGAAADARFTAMFTAGGGAANTIAFAWAHKERAAGPYEPSRKYQYNNRGGRISVTRSTVGSYEVTIPGSSGATGGGSVKVTAQGNEPAACKVENWWPNADATAQTIRVRCFAGDGKPADSKFTITYVDGMNLLGDNLMSDAYVWADEPSTASYTPHPWYQHSASPAGTGTVTITRAGTGSYDVLLPLHTGYQGSAGISWDGGNVQATAYGPGSERCQVGYWRDQERTQDSDLGRVVRVYCFTAAGVATDTPFTLQYTAQVR